MESRFEVYFSKYFIGQWEQYDDRLKSFLNNKFTLISANPFRFKSHKGYRNVFKIKLDIHGKYSRLMYAVFLPDEKSVSILGVFPRDLNYKDFDRIFAYMRK
jgi:hypothetical protein